MISKALSRLIALGASALLFGVTPDEVQQELNVQQQEFEEAKEIFNPWYAGPLITGSANTLPKGKTNIQPYLFITDTYGVYNGHRHKESIDDILSISPQMAVQWGLTDRLLLIVSGQVVYNNQNGASAWNFNDTTVGLAYGVVHETTSRPAVRIGVTESFPSGRYQDLRPRLYGVDATGSGSYKTTFSLNLSKVTWWSTLHPMSFRGSFNYTVASDAHVEGFNSYGGGYGTSGDVDVGNSFTIDLGYEFSFTQEWVFALDVVYQNNNKSTFSGHKGLNTKGETAHVGIPSSDQLSLAPAIEYNPNANLGWLAGLWFTATGRNSGAFVSGILSVTYTY